METITFGQDVHTLRQKLNAIEYKFDKQVDGEYKTDSYFFVHWGIKTELKIKYSNDIILRFAMYDLAGIMQTFDDSCDSTEANKQHKNQI